LNLLHSPSGDSQVAIWGSLCLFHEGVQNHHSLTNEEAVKRTPYPFSPARPKLEEPVTHGTRMWHSQIRTKLHQELDHSGVVGQYADRPAFYLGSDASVEVLDPIRHGFRLSNV
jgi:hypothetical protein